MKLVAKDSPINLSELEVMAKNWFGNLVKAVIDIDKGIMVVDAGLHADEEALLLQNGSKQTDLWGINLYPAIYGEEWIEFDSMINLRPFQENNSRSVEDPKIQEKIKEIVAKLVTK